MWIENYLIQSHKGLQYNLGHIEVICVQRIFSTYCGHVSSYLNIVGASMKLLEVVICFHKHWKTRRKALQFVFQHKTTVVSKPPSNFVLLLLYPLVVHLIFVSYCCCILLLFFWQNQNGCRRERCRVCRVHWIRRVAKKWEKLSGSDQLAFFTRSMQPPLIFLSSFCGTVKFVQCAAKFGICIAQFKMCSTV